MATQDRRSTGPESSRHGGPAAVARSRGPPYGVLVVVLPELASVVQTPLLQLIEDELPLVLVSSLLVSSLVVSSLLELSPVLVDVLPELVSVVQTPLLQLCEDEPLSSEPSSLELPLVLVDVVQSLSPFSSSTQVSVTQTSLLQLVDVDVSPGLAEALPASASSASTTSTAQAAASAIRRAVMPCVVPWFMVSPRQQVRATHGPDPLRLVSC